MSAIQASRSETREQLDIAMARRKTMSHLRLGDALVQEKVITEGQRDAALAVQTGDKRKLLGEILVDSGAVTREELRRVLAEQLGVPSVYLATFPHESSAVEAVSGNLARKHMVMPLYRSQARITVAIENPLSWEALQELERFTGLKVDPVMATHGHLIGAITKAYGEATSSEPSATYAASGEMASPVADRAGDAAMSLADNAVARLGRMMAEACGQGAFNIHIEPVAGDGQGRVRFRVDGILGPQKPTRAAL
jgi:Type II secretion system (T2SS), protein E, N-terminal domain